MTTTLPMRLQLWQSAGEIVPGSPSSMISPISDQPTTISPVLTPTSDGSNPIGTFDLIKSKSVLPTSNSSQLYKTLPYPTHVESTTTQPPIRRVMSLMNLPSSLDNRNTHTAYTPPSATRSLQPSPSWENLMATHQQRMYDLRIDQYRRRHRGITPASYLYAGATYKGQQSVHHGGRDLSWTVTVRILGLDLRHGVCCGMMEARDIPEQKPGAVTTYWEGQIVDNINHCFFTGRWDVTCQQDDMAWSQFVSYIPLRHLVCNQQPLMQQCYPVEGEGEHQGKPDQHTADRIYAKLQQLKRLAQQPPPRMESCIEEEMEDMTVCDDIPESTVEPSIVEAEVIPSEISSEPEETLQEDSIEDISSTYDEFACIASHHRLTRKLNRSSYIFMRWKEMSFDEQQDKAKGFTIAGFYYIVMDRNDGTIIGIFQDQRTCAQRLVLKHVERSDMGQSFSEYHFH